MPENDELEPEPDLDFEPPPSQPDPIAPLPKLEPDLEPEVALEDDLEFVAAPAPPPKPTRKASVKGRGGRAPAIALAAGAVAVIVVLAAVILFRQQVVQAVPAAAGAYAAVGLPVDRLGLVIEQVKSRAVLEAGRPVLSVTGVVRNTRDLAAEAPPIRVSLLDKAGNPVAGKIAQPLNGRIPPGATRYFAISLPDPPAGSHELEIAFEAAEASHPAAAAAPKAVEPAEAQPLAPGSPDSLEKHG